MVFITFYTCYVFYEITFRLLHHCPTFSYQGYAQSEFFEAFSVYAGAGAGFYLQQYRANLSWFYLYSIFQLVEGTRVLFRLICRSQ